MRLDLSGKVAVITGASRGIGRQTALTLAQAGATVVLTSRGPAAGAVAAEVTAAGGQSLAIAADVSRAEELRRIAVPTLVLHGADDPLVPPACGEDTARRIPGARFQRIPGMGHDLPPGVVEQLLAALLPHLRLGSGA